MKDQGVQVQQLQEMVEQKEANIKDLQERLQELQETLGQKEATIRDLQERFQLLQETHEQCEQGLKDLEERVQKLNGAIAKHKERIAKQDEKISKKDEELTEANASVRAALQKIMNVRENDSQASREAGRARSGEAAIKRERIDDEEGRGTPAHASKRVKQEEGVIDLTD
jgi:chromosome segregation ATPase